VSTLPIHAFDSDTCCWTDFVSGCDIEDENRATGYGSVDFVDLDLEELTQFLIATFVNEGTNTLVKILFDNLCDLQGESYIIPGECTLSIGVVSKKINNKPVSCETQRWSLSRSVNTKSVASYLKEKEERPFKSAGSLWLLKYI
jgi:hypothetical protein